MVRTDIPSASLPGGHSCYTSGCWLNDGTRHPSLMQLEEAPVGSFFYFGNTEYEEEVIEVFRKVGPDQWVQQYF